MPRIREGRIVRAVIKAKIFRDNEYVFVPFADSEIVSASRPSGITWPWANTGRKNKIKTILRFLIG